MAGLPANKFTVSKFQSFGQEAMVSLCLFTMLFTILLVRDGKQHAVPFWITLITVCASIDAGVSQPGAHCVPHVLLLACEAPCKQDSVVISVLVPVGLGALFFAWCPNCHLSVVEEVDENDIVLDILWVAR